MSVKNKLQISIVRGTIYLEEFHTNYKKYRNLLSTLKRKIKQVYYNQYFERT